jgi:5-enolpyruvylshikimate-3-phosphate synthase
MSKADNIRVKELERELARVKEIASFGFTQETEHFYLKVESSYKISKDIIREFTDEQWFNYMLDFKVPVM